MNWVDLLSILSTHWQGIAIGVVMGLALSYIARRFFVDTPAMSAIVEILVACEGLIKNLLGERWVPVYNAILKAASAAIDGQVTLEEAQEIARETFISAIMIIDVDLTPEERATVIRALDMLVAMLYRDKEKGSVAIRRAKVKMAQMAT